MCKCRLTSPPSDAPDIGVPPGILIGDVVAAVVLEAVVEVDIGMGEVIL